MATKRAKRLADYLENQLGWETHGEGWQCKNCEQWDYMNSNFCRHCGHRLPKKPTRHEEVFAELEAAISHALEEDA